MSPTCDRSGALRAGLSAVLGPGTTAPPPGGCLAVADIAGRSSECAGVAQAFDDAGTLAAPPAITAETAIDQGSVTKVLATTSALMALVDAREVGLADRLRHLLPATADHPVGAASVADLLEHRAGLVEWWPLYLSASTSDAALDVVLSLPLRYEPGAARHYSDLGFLLLGAVVAEVTGRPLAEAVTRLVLEPYGLSATRYAKPAQGRDAAASSRGDSIEREMVRSGRPYPVDGDAASFPGWREHVLVAEVNDGNAFHACGGVAGHAGLFSSVDDLLTAGTVWLRSLTGDGPVSARTARRFLTPGTDAGQALGFRRWRSAVDGCVVDVFGHTGFPGIAIGIVPLHAATVVLATNRLHVDGPPRATEEMWLCALAAAHRALH